MDELTLRRQLAPLHADSRCLLSRLPQPLCSRLVRYLRLLPTQIRVLHPRCLFYTFRKQRWCALLDELPPPTVKVVYLLSERLVVNGCRREIQDGVLLTALWEFAACGHVELTVAEHPPRDPLSESREGIVREGYLGRIQVGVLKDTPLAVSQRIETRQRQLATMQNASRNTKHLLTTVTEHDLDRIRDEIVLLRYVEDVLEREERRTI